MQSGNFGRLLEGGKKMKKPPKSKKKGIEIIIAVGKKPKGGMKRGKK